MDRASTWRTDRLPRERQRNASSSQRSTSTRHTPSHPVCATLALIHPFFVNAVYSVTMAEEAADPAEARKRRKAIITSQRQDNETEAQPAAACDASQSASLPEEETNASNDTKAVAGKLSNKRHAPDDESVSSSNNGKDKKTQIRYDPEVPMSKEQLAVWRREARRVRNRESAAASRQRIRSRITELEDEIEDWKSKYEQAQQRLAALEQVAASQEAAGGPSAKV